MANLREELTRAAVEQVVAARIKNVSPTALVDNVRITDHANGDISIGVDLIIPMNRVDVKLEDRPSQLIGCADEEL